MVRNETRPHGAREGTPPTTSLATMLRDQRDAIVSRFVAEVRRKNLSPPDAPGSVLIDHIPRFVDQIVDELSNRPEVRTSHEALDTSRSAREHGEQRWSVGYDVQSLIREYGILRHCILDAAKETGITMTIDEFDVLAKCVNVGVAEATTQYTRFRDAESQAQRARMEFLAEAGTLLTSSLDYHHTIGRLVSLLVPRLADWCAVDIEGGDTHERPIAHVDPAKVALLRDALDRFPLRSGSRYGLGRVLETGEPLLVERADDALLESIAKTPEHLELLRNIGLCSWIIVPLRAHGHVFGALTVAYSDSKRHYDPSDLALAGELARRAAIAIDNARLYELSQKERSRIEAADRAKNEFVAMVSHELRTPLNAILGWTRLLRTGSMPPDKQAHALEVIERNAEAQRQLVADLLDISRMISGRIRINPSQVDLTNVVEMAIEGVRPAADAKRIRIETRFAPGETVLRADGDRLQQVVWNLLTNAVKFTPKGGAVDVTLQRVDSDLEVVVSDTGDGIPPSFLPHVFESFRQSDGGFTRRHGGLGIGLSIAKHIVELHGGTITARSDGPGKGATFDVRLPISPLVSTVQGVTRAPATKPQHDVAELPYGHEGIRVLVVDDEPDARELVGYVLESSGMEVVLAASVAEAHAAIERARPDVVVSDVGMPDEDGYALIRRLRTGKDEGASNIPAIALTAFARSEDRTRALVEGFNLHMAKPVEPAALVRAVADLAGGSKRPKS